MPSRREGRLLHEKPDVLSGFPWPASAGWCSPGPPGLTVGARFV